MNFRCKAILIAVVAAMFMAAEAASPKWEQINSATESIELRSDGSDHLDIVSRDGYIYISTRQPINVKLFTILGQLITQETLPAGTHRFRLSTRGIYLLKAGNLTRRITV